MKTEHDFFSDFIEAFESDGNETLVEINRIYTLIFDYLSKKEHHLLFYKFFMRAYEIILKQAPLLILKEISKSFLIEIKKILRKKIIDRLKVTLHADDRFTPQEVRDKSWEFEQEYRDKELDLDEIGGDIEEYTTRIVNECYRPPTKNGDEQ